MIAVNPHSIPDELKQLNQWVNWRYLERDGKQTKPPINSRSNGRLALAKTNDPGTWSQFDEALVACEHHAELQGFGFCFWESDGLSGIDLDHVLNPATGEIKPEAAEVLERFKGTYTEISPGGDGFHILCKGKARRSGKTTGKTKWLEAYTHPSHRYLTVTGNHWPGSATDITNQQDALDWLDMRFMSTEEESRSSAIPPVDAKPIPSVNLDDAALIAKIRASKQGALFERLWRGDAGEDHSASDLALCNLLAFWTDGDVARMDRLFRQSGLVREKWDKPHFADGRTYGQATLDKAVADLREGYGGRRLDSERQAVPANTIRESHSETASTEAFKLPTVSQCTHLANSYRIRHYYQGRLWYALGLGWIMWTGKFWRPDPTNEGSIATGFVDGLSRLIARESADLSRRASDEADEDRRKALMTQAEALLKWAVQSENERTIAAGLKLTKHALLIEYSTLNADPWLFNVQNGTIDLRTGTLRPHDPADLVTFISPVTYDPAATCPVWEHFLSEVFAGDQDMVAFIQRAVGWSLTGVVKERALFFLYGDTGKNGKTTMVEAIMKIVGNYGESCYGYGRKVGAETFMKSRNMEDNQRKAATLAGPRFVCTSEVDEEHRLNEQLIKDITGGDTIEGRRLYQEAFTFKPQFKPWMYGNHKPEIRGTDDAIWSRVRLVPFEVSFRGREDLDLPIKLEAELSGILNWALRGCLSWQAIGLQPPAKVQAATDAYREEMDVFGPFIRECCVIHRLAEVRANDLWTAYRSWCEENGLKEQTQTKFGKYLNAKGTSVERSNGIKRIGIGLLDKQHSDSDYFGTVGTVGTLKPKSTLEKPPIGTFPPNPSNCSNPSKTTEDDSGISSHHPASNPSVDNKNWGDIE
jgi:putative DNA primase/helicase